MTRPRLDVTREVDREALFALSRKESERREAQAEQEARDAADAADAADAEQDIEQQIARDTSTVLSPDAANPEPQP